MHSGPSFSIEGEDRQLWVWVAFMRDWFSTVKAFRKAGFARNQMACETVYFIRFQKVIAPISIFEKILVNPFTAGVLYAA